MTSSANVSNGGWNGAWRLVPPFMRRSSTAPVLPSDRSQIEALTKACSTMQPLPEGPEGIEQLKEMRYSEVYTICYNLADRYYADPQGLSFQEKLTSTTIEIRKICQEVGVDHDQLKFLLKLAFLERGLYEAVWQARTQFKERGAWGVIAETDISPAELASFNTAYPKLTQEQDFSFQLLSVYSLSSEKALRLVMQKKMLINSFGNPNQVLSQIQKLDAELFSFAVKAGVCEAGSPSVSLLEVLKAKNQLREGMEKQTISRLIQSRANLVWVYNQVASSPMELERARQIVAPLSPPSEPLVVTPRPTPPVVATGVAYPSLAAPVSSSSTPAPVVSMAVSAPAKEKREQKESKVRDEEGGVRQTPAAATAMSPVQIRALIDTLKEVYKLREQPPAEAAPRPLDSMEVILKKRALCQSAMEIIAGLGLKQKTEEQLQELGKQFIQKAESSEIFKRDLFFYYIFEAAKDRGVDTSEDGWAEKHGIEHVNIFVAGLTRYTKEYLI